VGEPEAGASARLGVAVAAPPAESRLKAGVGQRRGGRGGHRRNQKDSGHQHDEAFHQNLPKTRRAGSARPE
jgi:hypothetical protein